MGEVVMVNLKEFIPYRIGNTDDILGVVPKGRNIESQRGEAVFTHSKTIRGRSDTARGRYQIAPACFASAALASCNGSMELMHLPSSQLRMTQPINVASSQEYIPPSFSLPLPSGGIGGGGIYCLLRGRSSANFVNEVS
jgi:hypothetical protein